MLRSLFLTIIFMSVVPMIVVYPYIGVLVWNWVSIFNPHRLSAGFIATFPLLQFLGGLTILAWLFSKEKKLPPNHPIIWAAGLLCRWQLPENAPHWLMVSPFAEEQSRARRLQYDMSAYLAAKGIACCWFDLPGTGDSPLDETDITLDIWLKAVSAAVAQLGASLQAIGGLRLGAAVATHWAKQLASSLPLLPLEPISGPSALRSLLRTRAGQDGANIEALMASLAGGDILEAAGYPLGPNTMRTLQALELAAGSLAIKSVLSDLPPWLQVEPASAATLAAHLADLAVQKL